MQTYEKILKCEKAAPVNETSTFSGSSAQSSQPTPTTSRASMSTPQKMTKNATSFEFRLLERRMGGGCRQKVGHSNNFNLKKELLNLKKTE